MPRPMALAATIRVCGATGAVWPTLMRLERTPAPFRRFKAATGLTLIDYLQNLRIEEAKRLLETCDRAVDEISYEVGYEDASFFRRLFKRRTGLAPARYRRMFTPIEHAENRVASRR